MRRLHQPHGRVQLLARLHQPQRVRRLRDMVRYLTSAEIVDWKKAHTAEPARDHIDLQLPRTYAYVHAYMHICMHACMHIYMQDGTGQDGTGQGGDRQGEDRTGQDRT